MALGLGDALWLRATAERYGAALGVGARVLEFAYSTGRVLRHLRMLAPEADFAGEMPGPRVVLRDLEVLIKNLNSIHSQRWVRDRWGAIFEIEEVIEYANGDHQDAMTGTAHSG